MTLGSQPQRVIEVPLYIFGNSRSAKAPFSVELSNSIRGVGVYFFGIAYVTLKTYKVTFPSSGWCENKENCTSAKRFHKIVHTHT